MRTPRTPEDRNDHDSGIYRARSKRPSAPLGAMMGLTHSESPLLVKMDAIRRGERPSDLASTSPGFIATVKPGFKEHLERWEALRSRPVDADVLPQILGNPAEGENLMVRMDKGGFYNHGNTIIFYPKGSFRQVEEGGPRVFVADFGADSLGFMQVPTEEVFNITGHKGDYWVNLDQPLGPIPEAAQTA